MTVEHDVVGPPKHVAVIAVHGVGYTLPGATAKHLSDLLLGLGRLKLDEQTVWPDAVPPYDIFEKSALVVGLKRPYLEPADRKVAGFRVADKVGWRLLHVFDERMGYLAKAFSKDISAEDIVKQVRGDIGKIAQEFMRVQLAGYISEDEGQAYETVCFEGERRENRKPSVTVHVYESYWADLSHPNNQVLSFFLAFYLGVSPEQPFAHCRVLRSVGTYDQLEMARGVLSPGLCVTYAGAPDPDSQSDLVIDRAERTSTKVALAESAPSRISRRGSFCTGCDPASTPPLGASTRSVAMAGILADCCCRWSGNWLWAGGDGN